MKGKSVTNKMFTRGRNRCSFLSFLSFLVSSWVWYVLNMVSLKPGLDVIAEMLKKQLSLTLGFRGRIQAGDINVKHAVRYISWGIGMWAEDNLGLDSIQRSGAEASSLKPTTKKRRVHQMFPGIQVTTMCQGEIMSNVDTHIRRRTGISILVKGLQAWWEWNHGWGRFRSRCEKFNQRELSLFRQYFMWIYPNGETG